MKNQESFHDNSYGNFMIQTKYFSHFADGLIFIVWTQIIIAYGFGNYSVVYLQLYSILFQIFWNDDWISGGNWVYLICSEFLLQAPSREFVADCFILIQNIKFKLQWVIRFFKGMWNCIQLIINVGENVYTEKNNHILISELVISKK